VDDGLLGDFLINFEELEPGDFELVASWLSDPVINRWLVDWRDKKVDERIVGIVSMNPRNKLFLVKYDCIKLLITRIAARICGIFWETEVCPGKVSFLKR
jgi:hypothetical protein